MEAAEDKTINIKVLHKPPEIQIPKVIATRFKVRKFIASGSFGAVYSAFDEKVNKNVAIKLAKKHDKNLYRESKVYKKLEGLEGICDLIWFGEENDIEGETFTCMVMEYGGLALDKLLKRCGGSFKLLTVLRLGFEMLLRVQSVHETAGLIHRDIKPANFSYNSKRNIIFLLDFGLAKEYSEQNEGKSCKKGIGTKEYCSINSGLGFEQSFRDDLESIGYVLIYFLCGSLPWKGIKQPTGEERVSLITNLKMSTPIKTGHTKHRATKQQIEVPSVFVEYMEYVNGLDFTSRPNYEYLRNNFREYFDNLDNLHKKSYKWEQYFDHSEINK